jgi:hypothetical protein
MIGSWRYSVGVPVWRRHHEATLILSHPLAKPLRRLRDPELFEVMVWEVLPKKNSVILPRGAFYQQHQRMFG